MPFDLSIAVWAGELTARIASIIRELAGPLRAACTFLVKQPFRMGSDMEVKFIGCG